ncbi:maleylpyruvate isomerase N-terminal domain-containing protein [Streptomyces sp. HF10]|uniref:maleylpyruvate isomerase N-terminal domain-containing protein n=1 Tax=Streptomyces sp. HF10 TaxID=2692233 RepID=UPI003FA74E03
MYSRTVCRTVRPGRSSSGCPGETGLLHRHAAERRESANLCEELSPTRWQAPSLRADWRVREVAAHRSRGSRYPTAKVLPEPAEARGSLHRMTDRLARRDAGRPGPGPARPHRPHRSEDAHRFVTR